MANHAAAQPPAGIRRLSRELMEAEDEKVRRVVMLLDQQSAPEAARTILDPLRPRLAALRVAHPLRFERLLFLPFDSVIVEALHRRAGHPTIPRIVLASIGQTVRAGLGSLGAKIDDIIRGRDTHDTTAITQGGDLLWPCAAAILAKAPAPVAWAATGLPETAYPTLARAIAAVLRRAIDLRDLVHDATLGVTELNEAALCQLLSGIATESQEGCGMLVALLVEQLPHAAMHLRQVITTGIDRQEQGILRKAIDQSLNDRLTRMEDPGRLDNEIHNTPLCDVGKKVLHITALLGDFDDEPDMAKHRPRLRAIRSKLDEACRSRFDTGLTNGLLTPLTAATSRVDGPVQIAMEANARDLRTLETQARRIGSASTYDTLLGKAAEVVRSAATSGVLTPVRQLRLIEILAGPEAAKALLIRKYADSPDSCEV